MSDENMVKEVGYLERVDAISEEVREVIRESLAEIGEWTRNHTQLKNYNEIRRFLREMVDVSV